VPAREATIWASTIGYGFSRNAGQTGGQVVKILGVWVFFPQPFTGIAGTRSALAHV
jgi:hypothetical protein